MKVDILKSFKGSPDGRHAVQYNAGDKGVELTDSLAEVALAEGWAKPLAAEQPAVAESPAAPEEKKKTKGAGKAASARSSGANE